VIRSATQKRGFGRAFFCPAFALAMNPAGIAGSTQASDARARPDGFAGMGVCANDRRKRARHTPYCAVSCANRHAKS